MRTILTYCIVRLGDRVVFMIHGSETDMTAVTTLGITASGGSMITGGGGYLGGQMLPKSSNPTDVARLGLALRTIGARLREPTAYDEECASTNACRALPLPEPGRLVNEPGNITLRVTEFLLSKRTFDRLVLQVVEDMREEYREALLLRRPWKARFVAIRGHLAVCHALRLHTLAGWLERVIAVWRALP